MAEAHSAVAFQFVVTQEGLNFNVNKEVLRAVWRSGLRSWGRRWHRFVNHLHNCVFPFRPSSWLVLVVLVCAISLMGFDISGYGVASIEHVCVHWLGMTNHVHAFSCVIFACVLFMSGILFNRYTLLLLFSYQNWIYERMGKASLKTKIWVVLVKLLSGFHPRIFSYQASLPKLPVPALTDTISRYLISIRPFTSDEEYSQMKKLSEEFLKKIGSRLQFYLILKSWWATNYVSDWWEEYVYLYGRGPIMVNANFYGVDSLSKSSNGSQASRAANIVFYMLEHMHNIDKELMKPNFINNMVPLCSFQYERQFNSTRIPGEEKDRLMHTRDHYYIVVYCRGRYFKCYFHYDGVDHDPVDLEQQFNQILEDKSEPCSGEKHLGALTAGDRVPWARARQQFFSAGVNKASMHTIDQAAFLLVFDDEEYECDLNDPSKLNFFAKSMLHGKGYDRWFDKSFNLVVCKSGRIGFNAEHSWGDAPIMAHLWEICLTKDYLSTVKSNGISGYTAEGNCLGTPKSNLPTPTRLKWDIPDECQEVIATSLSTAQHLLEDVDLHIMVYQKYGKGFMKKCRISPDAFLQMVLQLTYFREAGNFCLTYESCMTRFFREGRTETIRSCSIESEEFARCLDDPSKTNEERIQKFRVATDKHQRTTRDALTGKGVDRHLFCLYVVSKYLGMESPFLQKVLSEPWRLSTSQTPTRQTDLPDLGNHPDMISAGGGFGPVSDDGYGVSYIIAGEDCVSFHVSSKKSCPKTNSLRFSNSIEKSLADIKALFENA